MEAAGYYLVVANSDGIPIRVDKAEMAQFCTEISVFKSRLSVSWEKIS